MSEDAIRAELAAFKERMDDFCKTLREVRDKVLTTPICPQPGACVPLLSKTDDHEKRIRRIESVIDQARGAGALAKLLWFAIGGSAVGGLILAIQHFAK